MLDCPRTRLLLAIAAISLAPRAAPAEVFVLNQGGRVEGQLLNPDQVPRKTFQIRTSDGSVITLDRSQVKERVHQRPEKTEYDKIRPHYPDTVEAQWELAEWCRQRQLLSQRERHLLRILELSPDHEKARRGLGYSKSGNEWTKREDKMKAQGFVMNGGKWKLRQEVELIEAEKKTKAAEGRWQQDIRLWRSWLDGDKTATARQKFLTIKDPFAVNPLAKALADEPNPRVRLLLVDALAGIGTPSAARVLSPWALKDPDREVRLTCLDHLRGRKDPVAYFVSKLASSDNDEINRAAFALQQMEDAAAVRPLIDVLVTSHRHKRTIGGGRTNAAFGSGGGGGLSMGSKTVVVQRELQNRAVLDALVALADGPSLGFDVAAWKSWYASQRRPSRLNARRD